MANRVSLAADKYSIEERFGAQFTVDLLYEPMYYIRGLKQENLFIVTEENPKEITPAIWGLIPENLIENPELMEMRYGDYTSFIKNKKTFMADSEQLLTKRFYRNSTLKKRCLIICDGFYLGNKRDEEKGISYHYISDGNGGRELFAIAGIYTNLDSDLFTCSAINIQSNERFITIAKRMPLILKPKLESEWLKKELDKDGLRLVINYGFTPSLFQSHEVDGTLLSSDGQMNNPNTIAPIG